MRARRDPRAEREARRVGGGLRPRFALAATASDGGRRRDPRAEWAAARVPGGARVRFDLARRGDAGAAVAAPPPAVALVEAAPIRVVEAPAFLVAACVAAPGGRLTAADRQLLGAARLLAEPGGAVVLVAGCVPDDAGGAGADRVVALGEAADPDGAAARTAAALEALSVRHALWGDDADAGDLARRVAVRLGAALFAGAEGVSAKAAIRPAKARSVEQRAAPPRLLTLADGAAAPARSRGEARPLAFDPPPATPRMQSIDVPPDPRTVALAEAEFVVAAGNGVTDFAAFNALAAALGGTPGASRMVCDAGLMPRAAQVGASGTVLAARCYLAFGIAGAPQHLEGVAKCEHVVAVNTDLHAAMVARADLAVVADAQAVMPALLATLGGGEAAAPPPAAPLGTGGRARVGVLIGEGRHPASGRAMLGAGEAAAAGIAAALDDAPFGMAAGPDAVAAREALGRGLTALDHLAMAPELDVVDALVDAVRSRGPDLLLAGMRSAGDGSGLVPYLVAHRLGWPLVSGAVAVQVAGGMAIVEQALPRGARRRTTVALPAVVTVSEAAPARPYAYAKARRGVVRAQAATGPAWPAAEERPYRRRPKAAAVPAGSAAERLAAATGPASAGGRLLLHPAPEEAAAAILEHLRGLGLATR